MEEKKIDDQLKIKTLCDFLFFDQFQDTATFPRFEQCFQPLFNNIKNISMETVFKDICGPKKKYITYKRFAKAYLNHKNGKDNSEETKLFFDKLLNSILKEKNIIGNVGENIISFSTKKTCKNRDCISLIQILSDVQGAIHGINLEYDGVFQSKMYPKNLEEILVISLEMKLGIIDDKSKIEENFEKFSIVKQGNHRDAVTHIFGTINNETGLITFLGFKCISGKTVFVGFPDGDGFLFGMFGHKLHNLKVQMTESGLTLLEPGFKENLRKNFFLSEITGDLSSQNLDEEELIKDEEHFQNIKDEDEIDKLITTQIVKDDHFFNNRLKDEISGNDYKEVVDQQPRQWIINDPKQKYLQTCIMKTSNSGKSLDLKDALQLYDNEQQKTKIKAKTIIKSNLQSSKLFQVVKVTNKHFYDKWLEPSVEFKVSFDPESIDMYEPNLPKISNPFSGSPKAEKEEKDIPKNEPQVPKIEEKTVPEMDPIIEEKGEEDDGILLHKTKIFKPSKAKGSGTIIGKGLTKIGTGKVDGKTQINSFIRKDNYQKLKQKLGRMIHEQVMEKTDNQEQLEILDEIVPYPGSRTRIMKKSNFSDIINTDTKIRMKNSKGKVVSFKNEQIKESKENDNDNDAKKIEEKEEIEKNKEDENIVNSEAIDFWNKITDDEYKKSHSRLRAKQKTISQINQGELLQTEKLGSDFDPKKYKKAQEKWKFFRQGLEKKNGFYLLQTIGSIIKAKSIIEKNIILPIEEQIKLYNLIEENQNIVEFLSQNANDEDDEETDEIYDLIPDEHPEKINSLAVIQKDLDNIRELLYEKKLKPEDRRKIEQLRDLYLKQKNILIENQTKLGKVQLVRKNCIVVEKYIKEEEEKRKKAQEEEQKRLEEQLQKEMEKEQAKIKPTAPVSIVARKKETRTFHKQQPSSMLQAFTDSSFPPKKGSLCPFDKEGWIIPEEVEEDDIEGWEEINWCRAEEIKEFKDYDVFVEGATLDDIKQGNIGDCYFFSTVGSLCSYPNFLENIFSTKERNEDHVYGVYLYLNGRWKLVLVDDYLPYKGNYFKQVSFSTSFQNELWVALIEKAWAKVNGCYARIANGGFCYEAFDVLTEAFTEHIELRFYRNPSKHEELWKKMEEALEKKYVMTAGTFGGDVDIDLEEVGLYNGHAYTLIKIYKVKTKKGEEKLLKLKNPWGNCEFTGEWSDYSKKWTPEIKKQCEFSEENDDGIFYMSFKDFMKYYMCLDIAKIKDNYQTSFCKVKKNQSTTCQVIELEVKEEYPSTFIQLYQKNPRIQKKDGTFPGQPVMAFIMLVRKEGKELKYINSVADNEVHIAIEVNLKPGTYYILSDVNYRYRDPDHKSSGYTVTCYARKSKDPLVLKNITDKIDHKSYLESSIFDYCKKKVEKTKDKSGLEIYKSQNFKREVPFQIFCFVNPTNKPIKVEVEAKTQEDNNKKCFCIYSDKIASEFDTSVIKEVKPNSPSISLIMGYTRESKYVVKYKVLPPSDTRTYLDSHSVFKSGKEPYDDENCLFTYAQKVEDGKGFIIGVENVSDKNYKLKLILEDTYCIDEEYKGKEKPEFELPPKGKKIFNLRVTGEDATFDFEIIK